MHPGETCPEGTISCGDDTACLSKTLFCDGKPQCPDRSDEEEGFCKGSLKIDFHEQW